MASKIVQYFQLIREASSEFLDDNCTKLSASLAYYTIFSIGPLLLVIITVLGFFYKRTDAVTGKLFGELGKLIGQSEAAQLKTMIENISHQNHTTLFGIIGVLVLLFGATGIFSEIQSSINYIWSIKAKPKRGWLKYITDRLLSFSLVIGMGFLLIVTLFINLIMDVLTDRLQSFMGHSDTLLLQAADLTLLFVVVTFLFAVIYKVLPDAKIYWKDALAGASFTGVLFLLGKFLITYYLTSSKTFNAYGAAASIILLLSWVYYTALILYFGAEFTKVYAMKWGRGITVFDTAVYIIKREAKEMPNLKHPIQVN